MTYEFGSTEFGRMGTPTDGLRLQVTSKRAIEQQIVNGEVVSERELDAIPDVWPESRSLWMPPLFRELQPLDTRPPELWVENIHDAVGGDW